VEVGGSFRALETPPFFDAHFTRRLLYQPFHRWHLGGSSCIFYSDFMAIYEGNLCLGLKQRGEKSIVAALFTSGG